MYIKKDAAPLSEEALADLKSLLDADQPGQVEETNETTLTPNKVASATEAEKLAQEARAKKYHIGIKEGGNVTKPSEWADVPDAAWGDPTNYRYPMPDKVHADNAAARWGDERNRAQYNSQEQAIIGRRIAARQRYFGESSDKNDQNEEKSMKDIVQTIYSPDGKASVDVYDDGSSTAYVHSETPENETPIAREVMADGSHEPFNGSHIHPHTCSDGMMATHLHTHKNDSDHTHCGGMPSSQGEKSAENASLTTKREKAVSPDDDKVPDASEVKVREDGTHVACMGVHTHEVTDSVTGETAKIEHKHENDAEHDGLTLAKKDETSDAAVEKKEAEKEGGKEAEKSASVLDPNDPRALLLKTYNDLGASLGFAPVSLTQKSIDDKTLDQVKWLAKALDDNSDALLRLLGVPDNDDEVDEADEANGAKSAHALAFKSGKTISAATSKRFQIAHDVLAEMCAGVHCAAFLAKHSDAPAEMARQEEAEKSLTSAETVEDAVQVAVQVNTEQIDAVVARLDALAKAFEGVNTKALEQETAAAKQELALTRKALEETRAQAVQAQITLEELTGKGLGRPTQTFTMRETPAGIAVGVGEETAVSAPTQVKEATSLEEALAQTRIEYVPGAGLVRVWDAGVGKGFRPPLTPEQMSGMTTFDISAYYSNGAARVPALQDAQGNFIN